MHAYRDQYAQIFNHGRGVVLMAISIDPIEELAAWARDDEFPFLMASDASLQAAERYGAVFERGEMRGTNRSLFVIGPDGRVAHVMAPFREIDPTAYVELEEAVRRVMPAPAEEPDGAV
jgi:thioredoxin-dependent peroxiredoxin